MLQIDHLGKTYGSGAKATHAVGDITFDVEPREFVCVVGPSGCGKTTLLKCIAGLLEPSSGVVMLDGSRVTGRPRRWRSSFRSTAAP